MNHDSINHDGQVVEISGGKVVAEILVSEACGTCQAKGLCHTNGKRVRVEAEAEPGQEFKVGQQVRVSFTPTLAMSSVLLAYVLPLVLMFAVMFTLIAITGSQDIGCVSGLAVLPVYYTILYMLRHKLRRKFKFKIF
ncbi:MAG: SoxR reducing system RseC family protein [Bacteroidales bacterium]|jgi:sigma-E factor negative regulatory protein RseC|nr:SoxR reducing system RseC family protein [Bacteroidales bacterium]MBR4271696.1 SoxR reducing system RseC family protein [Bacteroidales bacterium]